MNPIACSEATPSIASVKGFFCFTHTRRGERENERQSAQKQRGTHYYGFILSPFFIVIKLCSLLLRQVEFTMLDFLIKWAPFSSPNGEDASIPLYNYPIPPGDGGRRTFGGCERVMKGTAGREAGERGRSEERRDGF